MARELGRRAGEGRSRTSGCLSAAILTRFVVNDGYNDLIGTLIGTPDQTVAVPGHTFQTEPYRSRRLLKALPQAERYSYVFDGSAQVLDHVLINKKLGERLVKFGYARLDADFPVVWSGDASRPERVSDHDAPIAFFSLDAAQTAGPPKPRRRAKTP